jgi:hypothetical protein
MSKTLTYMYDLVFELYYAEEQLICGQIQMQLRALPILVNF